MRFFSPEQLLVVARVDAIDAGDVHVWPLLFPDRDGLRPLIRHLLGLYCGVDGQALQFVEGANGKPSFAAHQPFARSVSFNLTHSARRALLAVSGGSEIGVDLEQVRSRTNALAIARRYFFGLEYELVRDAPESQRQELFFRLWTAKEAVIKAQGIGLSAPLDRFQIVFDPAFETAAVESFDTSSIDADWFVRTLPCEPGWHAAVAARGRGWRVRLMEGEGGPVPAIFATHDAQS